MNITILNVATETKMGKNKKPYQVLDIAFKNNTFQGKVDGKKLMPFGANADSFKTLATAQSGESYEITVVKNEAGYNDWTSAVKGGAAAPVAPASANVGYGASKAQAAPPRSNYETPEERAQRQIYIVRQSSIANAVALLLAGAKAAPKVDDVITTAKQFEAYVFDTGSGLAGIGDIGFEDLPNFDISE